MGGFKLIPKLSTKSRTLMAGGTYSPRLYPKIVDGMPEDFEYSVKEKVGFISKMAKVVRPIDAAGRMDQPSLDAFRAAKDRRR